jgi:NADPH-dependent glutamate synthase beta subunit-like oxidoreductase/2,4-dienoyl-CoA reductase-like NADH-dependent reductase (Old Yellow Enzyme family)
MVAMGYEKLFSPIRIKGCTFPNRIMATAAVTRLAAEDGHVTDPFKERYKRMAKGGVGAMVVEAAVVLPSRSSFNLRVSDDRFIPELKAFIEAIRVASSDVRIGLQLIHFLKLARSGWRQKVEDLTPEEIKVIPEQFARGALRAQVAGFDFVELHMAHFTMLASFLSLMNKRKDSYGGDFEGRVKLPTEVVIATRESVGDDFPIGIRMNGEEFIKEGNTQLQSTRIARRLAHLGIGYISVSAGEKFEDAGTPPPNTPPFAGTGYSGYRMSPRWWHPDGVQVYLAEAMRNAVREAGYDLPIVTAGKIRTPELGEEILEKGRADIIGMARALLADPDWPIKSKEGRADEIVKCAACGYCSEADERYEPVTCIEWPKGALNAPSPWLLIPPCKAACPAGLDIRTYIEFITQGQYEKALRVIEEKIPLPGTVGRVCPRPCEEKCHRGHLDTPIAINGLKRFVAGSAALNRRENDVIPPEKTKEERVAIIGSGPAGLTTAFHLVKLGYPTTIFEALPVPGGMLTVGIPEYRLPREVVQREIEDIQKRGVEIRLNRPIGTGKGALSIDHLWQQGYKAIFIATGAHKSVKLGIPGEEMKGVYDGISLLKNVNLGKKVHLGKTAIILGGGNVAIDAARVARRYGVKEVSILYRRSEEEMPAYREDVEAAKAEGVEIHYLTSPVRMIDKDGRVTKVECIKTKLGEVDEGGRRRFEPVKGSEFVVEADTVIPAIGEIPDLSFLDGEGFHWTETKTIWTDPPTMMTGIKGVFAGGDVVSGPATVIEAIAAGRKAALSIDRYIRGERFEDEAPVPHTIGIEDVDLERVPQRERQRMSTLPMEERVKGFKEIEPGFTEMEALCEADRCFQCGLFPKRHD